MYSLLMYAHTTFAILTISGFLLRGYWMMQGSALLQAKPVRVLPHIVDTLFLLSGVAMLFMLSMNPFTQPWLVAKFIGLGVYIVAGSIALKRGPTLAVRVIAFATAVTVFAWIAGVALSRSPLSWLALLNA